METSKTLVQLKIFGCKTHYGRYELHSKLITAFLSFTTEELLRMVFMLSALGGSSGPRSKLAHLDCMKDLALNPRSVLPLTADGTLFFCCKTNYSSNNLWPHLKTDNEFLKIILTTQSLSGVLTLT